VSSRRRKLPHGLSEVNAGRSGMDCARCDIEERRKKPGALAALFRNSTKAPRGIRAAWRGIFAAREQRRNVESSPARTISSLLMQGFSHISSCQLG
jgi:hypothetical protein